MADVKHLIGQGIGFTPGSVKFIIMDGLQSQPLTAARHFINRGIGGAPGSVAPFILDGLTTNAGGPAAIERRWSTVWIAVGIRI